uniref:Uncharacterized protein n=1 Tax=Anguilla anguilla TaxID=7936 RepID=A0A0E9QF02_ANGAN
MREKTMKFLSCLLKCLYFQRPGAWQRHIMTSNRRYEPSSWFQANNSKVN